MTRIEAKTNNEGCFTRLNDMFRGGSLKEYLAGKKSLVKSGELPQIKNISPDTMVDLLVSNYDTLTRDYGSRVNAVIHVWDREKNAVQLMDALLRYKREKVFTTSERVNYKPTLDATISKVIGWVYHPHEIEKELTKLGQEVESVTGNSTADVLAVSHKAIRLINGYRDCLEDPLKRQEIANRQNQNQLNPHVVSPEVYEPILQSDKIPQPMKVSLAYRVISLQTHFGDPESISPDVAWYCLGFNFPDVQDGAAKILSRKDLRESTIKRVASFPTDDEFIVEWSGITHHLTPQLKEELLPTLTTKFLKCRADSELVFDHLAYGIMTIQDSLSESKRKQLINSQANVLIGKIFQWMGTVNPNEARAEDTFNLLYAIFSSDQAHLNSFNRRNELSRLLMRFSSYGDGGVNALRQLLSK